MAFWEGQLAASVRIFFRENTGDAVGYPPSVGCARALRYSTRIMVPRYKVEFLPHFEGPPVTYVGFGPPRQEQSMRLRFFGFHELNGSFNDDMRNHLLPGEIEKALSACFSRRMILV